MSELKILFICIGNTCRSPMAEAMARKIGGHRVRVHSAGINPTSAVVPDTIETIRSMGYNPRGLWTKHIDEVDLDAMDVIVSMIGPAGLRYLPHDLAARLETWSIQDPYGDDPEVYRSVARTIERKVRELLDELLAAELPSI
jgi:arsenate reductase